VREKRRGVILEKYKMMLLYAHILKNTSACQSAEQDLSQHDFGAIIISISALLAKVCVFVLEPKEKRLLMGITVTCKY
jgi:hypothetical protein